MIAAVKHWLGLLTPVERSLVKEIATLRAQLEEARARCDHLEFVVASQAQVIVAQEKMVQAVTARCQQTLYHLGVQPERES